MIFLYPIHKTAAKLQTPKATQISFNTELNENVFYSINLRQTDSLISGYIYTEARVVPVLIYSEY